MTYTLLQLSLLALLVASTLAGTCRDRNPDCASKPAKFKVDEIEYCTRPWAIRNCEKFCGYCGDKPQPVQNVYNPLSTCYDVYQACPDLKAKGGDNYCDRSWPKFFCTKTCGACETLTSVPTPACNNKKPNCAFMASRRRDFCNRPWGKNNCAFYCKTCEGGPVTTTTTTTTTAKPTTTTTTTAKPTTTTTTTAKPTTTTTTTAAPAPVALDCEAKFQSITNHTACLPKSPKATTIELSARDKMLIVLEHNAFRATVDPKPANMMKMYWDDELAMVAKRWAEACDVRGRLRHDSNLHRLIPGGVSVGQNLYSRGEYLSGITRWSEEMKDYTYGKPYRQHKMEGKVVGHYTAMIWANTYLVGCAAAKCDGIGEIFVCNYGPAGNMMPFDTPYEKARSDKGCDDCPDHCNENGLCDCKGLRCNGGHVNVKTCTCECMVSGNRAKYMTGDNCELQCKDPKDDMFFCGRDAFFSNCKHSFLVNQCPHMCGICPK